MFTGNSQKIEQVLVNLLVNAGQAVPDDRRGNITVRTRAGEKDVIIEVEDDGRGMNGKTLKQIFDPFFTTKRAKGGTGLGLPIAYRTVEEHGGTITVSSTPWVGTRFVIRIPHGGSHTPERRGSPDGDGDGPAAPGGPADEERRPSGDAAPGGGNTGAEGTGTGA